jgi:3-methyladenine DNA glycosylase AlkC
MERFQMSSDEAFRMLVRWAQNSNVKLRGWLRSLSGRASCPWAARHEERPKALLG